VRVESRNILLRRHVLHDMREHLPDFRERCLLRNHIPKCTTPSPHAFKHPRSTAAARCPRYFLSFARWVRRLRCGPGGLSQLMRRTVQNAKRSPDRSTRVSRHGSGSSTYSGIALSLLVASINSANITGVSGWNRGCVITAIGHCNSRVDQGALATVAHATRLTVTLRIQSSHDPGTPRSSRVLRSLSPSSQTNSPKADIGLSSVARPGAAATGFIVISRLSVMDAL
jgi:hypothetical protein